MNFGDFKDDRQISKNPVENSQYNLVERPTYLFHFKESSLEKMFLFSYIKADQFKIIIILSIFYVLNKLMLSFYAVDLEMNEYKKIVFYIISPVLSIYEVFLIFKIKNVTLESSTFISYALTIYFMVVALCFSFQYLHISHNSRMTEIFLMEEIVQLATAYFLGII